MPLMHLRVLHNTALRRSLSGQMPYVDGDQLVEVFDHWSTREESTTAEDVAGWAFLAFSAPLESLEDLRRQSDGETAFLAGCLYRLLGLRGLYIGDVVEVSDDRQRTWLACESKGWRHVTEPSAVDGGPLSAERIYDLLQSIQVGA